MDEIYSRQHYPRHKNNRRKRKIQKDNQPVMQTIIRQALIAILILALIGIIKNTNTKSTNYMSEKIKQNISYNINPKKYYASVQNVINKVKGNTLDNLDNSKTVPVGAGFDTSESGKSNEKTSQFNGKLIVPVDGYLSAGYGSLTNQTTGESEFHNGIDIEVKGDGSVKAAHDGKILETGSKKEYGNYLKIANGNTVTVYANCTAASSETGKSVKQGDVIAKVDGSTVCAGLHLHFEVWKDGYSVNPAEYITIKTE